MTRAVMMIYSCSCFFMGVFDVTQQIYNRLWMGHNRNIQFTFVILCGREYSWKNEIIGHS